MYLPFTLLKLSGQNVSNTNKTAIFLQFLCVYSLCVLGILYPILTPDAGIDTWAGAFDSIVFSYEWTTKTITYQIYKKSLQKLVQQMDDFWPIESIKLNRLKTKVMRFYIILVTATALTFVVTAINALKNGELPLAMYQIVDFTKFPYYQIVYVIYFAQIYVIVTFVMAFDGMFLAFLLDVGCQFLLINDELKAVQQDEMYDDELFIKRIVEHHAVLLEFMDELRQTFSGILLCQIASNVLANCMSIFLFNAIGIAEYSDVLQYIIYAIASSAQIFIYCLSGNQIKIIMEDIAETMYCTDWYDKDKPNLRNAALLVIQRAQKDSALKAGGMFKVDLELFVAIMRLSFSFFMLLQSADEYNKK